MSALTAKWNDCPFCGYGEIDVKVEASYIADEMRAWVECRCGARGPTVRLRRDDESAPRDFSGSERKRIRYRAIYRWNLRAAPYAFLGPDEPGGGQGHAG